MRICGLDLATRSGLAILDGDRLVTAQSFRPRGSEDDQIFHGFRQWLLPLLREEGVRHVAIEEPLKTNLERTRIVVSQSDAFGQSARKIREPVSNMATYLRLYGIFGHAREICYRLNIPYDVVNQREWRKAFIGVTNAPKGASDSTAWLKQRALQQCRLLGYDVKSKDAAEAIGVAFWLQGYLKIQHLKNAGELFRAKQRLQDGVVA